MVKWTGRLQAVALRSEIVCPRIAKTPGNFKEDARSTLKATWPIWCNCDCSFFSILRGLESGDGSREKSGLQKNVEFAANQNHEKHLNKKENCDEEKLFLPPLHVSCPESQPWISQATALHCCAALQHKLRCWLWLWLFRTKRQPGHSNRVCRDVPEESQQGQNHQHPHLHSLAPQLVSFSQLPKFLFVVSIAPVFSLQQRSGLQAAEGRGGPSEPLETDGLWVLKR